MKEMNFENAPNFFYDNPHWISMAVSKDAEDWIVAKGKERNEHAKLRGWKSKTDGDAERFHIAGVAGEWACSWAFKGKMNTHAGETRVSLAMGDIRFPDKSPVEIKCPRDAKPDRWDLIENAEKFKSFPDMLHRPYINCLFCLFPQFMVITGWAWGRDVYNGLSRTHGANKHEVRVLRFNQLRSPEELYSVFRIEKPDFLNPKQERKVNLPYKDEE